MAETERVEAVMFSSRRPAVWVCAALIVIGAVLATTDILLTFGHGELTVIAWGGGSVQLGALLLLGLIALPRRRIPWAIRITAVLLGSFFAAEVAAELNNGSSIVAPFVEESLKLICVAAVLWLARPIRRGPLDGLVIGFFVGLGFEVLEDVSYTFTEGVQSGSESAIAQVILRTIEGFGLHNFCTAIAGAALAYAFFVRGHGWWIALAGFASAVTIHFLWDNASVAEPLGHQVLYALMIASFVLVRVWATRIEKKLTYPTTSDGRPTAEGN